MKIVPITQALSCSMAGADQGNLALAQGGAFVPDAGERPARGLAGLAAIESGLAVASRYSWGAFATRTVDVYRKVAAAG